MLVLTLQATSKMAMPLGGTANWLYWRSNARYKLERSGVVVAGEGRVALGGQVHNRRGQFKKAGITLNIRKIKRSRDGAARPFSVAGLGLMISRVESARKPEKSDPIPALDKGNRYFASRITPPFDPRHRRRSRGSPDGKTNACHNNSSDSRRNPPCRNHLCSRTPKPCRQAPLRS
jgi:hypothetical protein